MLRLRLVLLVALVGLAAGAHAQPSLPSADLALRTTDVHDLLRRLQHKEPVPEDARQQAPDWVTGIAMVACLIWLVFFVLSRRTHLHTGSVVESQAEQPLSAGARFFSERGA
jgi:hypothetical protein